jgi:hypothetical protein
LLGGGGKKSEKVEAAMAPGTVATFWLPPPLPEWW